LGRWKDRRESDIFRSEIALCSRKVALFGSLRHKLGRRGSIQFGPKVALPDTIIMATGQLHGDVVITRNKKDFRLLRHLGKLRDKGVRPVF
jgi:predicted nucleic acid-binding protein